MTQIHTSRGSPLDAIDTVWATQSISDGVYNATPDGSWDLIHVRAADGRHIVFLTGQQSEPAAVPYEAGESSVVISFAAAVRLNTGAIPSDAAVFENLAVIADRFLFNGLELPLPTFDNAETIVEQLISAGILVSDRIVQRAMGPDNFAASERTLQRHFRQTTGLSQKDFDQIRRAQEAVRLLKAGGRPADVAAAAGYADQAHMTKSIKRIMGRLPSQVDDIHKL